MAGEPGLSVQLANFAVDDPGGWAPLLERARLADRVGVDRVVVSDHVVFGGDLDAYGDPAAGGTAGGRQPTGPDGHWLEPLTVLTAVAATTERVRLGTGVLLAALRRPAVLAKQVATLDVLSGGRVDLGVGIGWQRAEYEACGLDFGRRGALLDHTLEVCRVLWSERIAEHHDDRLSFAGIHAMPKPCQPGGIPVWVSGRINDRTVARLVRHGQGWIPWGDHVADPAPGIEVLRSALAAAGRDPAALQVQGTLAVVGRPGGGLDLEATMAPVAGLVADGVTDFRLSRRAHRDLDEEERVLSEVVAAFRATVGRPLP